jgi:sodium transport system permease protein
VRLAAVRTVFFKEVREILRDRRTVLVMLVLPIFLYPGLLVVVQQLVLFGQRSIEQAPAVVLVSGASEDAVRFLDADSALNVRAVAEGSPEALQTGAAGAVAVFRGDSGAAVGRQEVSLFFDASDDRSRRARDVLERRIAAWGDEILAERLREAGLPGSFAAPLAVRDSSVASPERLGGYALGRFLPPLLILMTLLGAFFPAIDLTAGEKERGTLETLLTTPVPAREIIAGKFLAVTAAALATATLNMLSILLTFEWGVFQLGAAADLQFRIPLATGGLGVLLMIPLAVFFAAVSIGLAVRAQSFKEAQTHLTPVQFASIIPMYLPMIPGISLSYAVAVVPIGGIAVLFRDLMAGTARPGPALVAVLAMVVYAAVALAFAARTFGREEVLFGGGPSVAPSGGLRERVASWRSAERGVPRPVEGLALVAVIALLYFYLGLRLQAAGVERGLFASQWLLLALPALAFVALGPYRSRPTLALRAPSPRALLAAVMIIAGGIPIGWLLGWMQSFLLEVPEEYLRAFQHLLTADSPQRLVWLVLLIAVTPAICEELVFRGVLLQSLGTEMTARKAVLCSAAIFGAFHLSFETVIRFLPTAWLGLLMGYVVWRTGSIFTSMLMHCLNNATALVLVGTTGLQAHLFGPSGAPRWLALTAAVFLLLGGLMLLPRRTLAAPPASGTRSRVLAGV